MKKNLTSLLLSVFFLLCTIPAQAQKKGKMATPPPADTNYEMFQNIYEQGLKYNDLAVSTQALHSMVALHPEDTGLRDTLARLYFQRGAWGQCILVTSEVLESQPNNEAMLELRAISRQTVGLPKESLADYEKLYGLKQNPYHLYEISTLQFSMRRFGECEANVNRLLANEGIKGKKMVLGNAERRQEVPFGVACLNLRGVLDMEQGKKDSAKEYLNAALKVMPEFELAKNNLAVLEGKVSPKGE